jgi:hypothetical protein
MLPTQLESVFSNVVDHYRQKVRATLFWLLKLTLLLFALQIVYDTVEK